MPRRLAKKKKKEKTKFKFKSTERFLQPDPKHKNLVLSKLVNKLMLDGKKSTAQRVVYDAMDILSKRVSDSEPLETLLKAVDNVKPRIEVPPMVVIVGVVVQVGSCGCLASSACS